MCMYIYTVYIYTESYHTRSGSPFPPCPCNDPSSHLQQRAATALKPIGANTSCNGSNTWRQLWMVYPCLSKNRRKLLACFFTIRHWRKWWQPSDVQTQPRISQHMLLRSNGPGSSKQCQLYQKRLRAAWDRAPHFPKAAPKPARWIFGHRSQAAWNHLENPGMIRRICLIVCPKKQ